MRSPSVGRFTVPAADFGRIPGDPERVHGLDGEMLAQGDLRDGLLDLLRTGGGVTGTGVVRAILRRFIRRWHGWDIHFGFGVGCRGWSWLIDWKAV